MDDQISRPQCRLLFTDNGHSSNVINHTSVFFHTTFVSLKIMHTNNDLSSSIIIKSCINEDKNSEKYERRTYVPIFGDPPLTSMVPSRRKRTFVTKCKEAPPMVVYREIHLFFRKGQTDRLPILQNDVSGIKQADYRSIIDRLWVYYRQIVSIVDILQVYYRQIIGEDIGECVH